MVVGPVSYLLGAVLGSLLALALALLAEAVVDWWRWRKEL